jgi:hypothetical protein
MIIRMRKNAQVDVALFDTVPREIRSIPRKLPTVPSSEHWQVDHSETSLHRVRRVSAVITCLSTALLFLGCNVYDSSLLESNPLAAGATDSGGSAGTGDAPSAGGSGSEGGLVGIGAAGAGASDESGGHGGKSGGGAGASSVGGASGGAGGATAGGSGGATAVAGSGGSTTTVGGTAAGGALNTSYSIIDDMEMPDQYIPSTDGRVGFWSLANDGTKGTQTPAIMTMSPIPGGRGTSMYALHTTAMGFTATGAQVDVDLNRKGVTRATYDASAYVALHFWAKVAVGSATSVHVAMPDLHTDPSGLTCAKAPQQCYDHWAADRTLTTDWAEYTIAFTDLNQYGWGANDVDALDSAHVYGIDFSWGIASMDLWIDDLAFVKK